MFNKQVLSRITSALNSAKAPAKKKDIIVDPRGQWDHPGQPTRIPANEITMRGVPYPVMAYPDNGQPQLMYPDQEYSFPGAKYVDEYPQMNRMRNGGTLPQAQKGINISDYNEYAFRKAAYDDSLSLYNGGLNQWKFAAPLSNKPNSARKYTEWAYKNKNLLDKFYQAQERLNARPIRKGDFWTDSDTISNKDPIRKLGPVYSYLSLTQYKKPVQPIYRSGKKPIKKYPDILVTDPNDPRIGQYSPNGNKYVLDVSNVKEAEIKTKEEPVEEIGRLPLKPLIEIPTKYSTEGIVPNANYLNTEANTIKPPASATQWVQNPKTGTWHQIERPVHPALLPTYNVHTGSYKQRGGSVLPKAVNGTPTCPEGYTFDLATKSCIPSGEFEYIEDADDQRYKNYLLQNNLYNYSQLPNYYQRDFLDYEDVVSGNFNKPWQEQLTYLKEKPKDYDFNYHYLKNNDLVGWEGSQAQEWDLTPKELNKFKRKSQFTWTPDIGYTWGTPEGTLLMKQFPPIGYQGHGEYTSDPYTPYLNINPNTYYKQSNYWTAPTTQFIEDKINRKELKAIYPTLSDTAIDKHMEETRKNPLYYTNNLDTENYHVRTQDPSKIDPITGLFPKTVKITPEKIASNSYLKENLPKKGANAYLQDEERGLIKYAGSYIPMWGKPLKRYVLRDEVIKPIDNEPVRPSTILKEPEEQKITEPTQKAVPRTMRVPVEGVEEYWVYDKRLGYSVKKQRPKVTYKEVPYTDEAPGSQDYNIQTGTPEVKKQKQGGALLTKKVTCKNCGWTWDAADGGDDITTCHKCGGQGLVHAKQGGTNKVVNAYSKHFQPGGEQETRLPKRIVNRYPGMQNVYGSEGENLNVIKDPNYAASDYGFGDIEFIHPGSGHVQYSDDYDYQSPTPDKYTAVYNPKGANKHDVFLDTMHGMRDDPEYMKLLDKFSAETKKARGTSMDHWYGVDSEKDPYLVGDGREQWDKNFIDGVLRSHLAKKGMGRHSSDVKGYKMEREESTPEMYKATDDIYKYLKGKFKKGGFQDDLGKNRKVFEDWTYGKDLGMTYLPKAQNGITISDPKEYAYRNKMYTDSLNLYNAYKMQDKLMGPYSGTSKDKYKWNTAELKKGRKKNMVPGIPYPVAHDYQNEKDQFKDGFDPWTARPEDLKLIKYYKSLGFTDKDIMYHSSPDVVSDKIRAVGTYDDGTAASPIYRKPKQKVTFGPNNVLPVEEKLELKTKPLQFIDTNRDIQDIVPNADYLKQYLQTRTANAIVPPASTLKWVQHPQTGTWYQIERPENTMLTPEYNIRTGSYKKQ